jgi:hypothetical protein
MSFRIFYTSAETETKLQNIYERHQQKSAMNAHAFVKKPAREFYVMDGICYYKKMSGLIETFHKCPTEPEDGGGIYELEPALSKVIDLFQSRHTTYRVLFEPNPYYVSGLNVVPATLYSIPGDEHDVPEILTVEIESNYKL